jgi:hypothetical protein
VGEVDGDDAGEVGPEDVGDRPSLGVCVAFGVLQAETRTRAAASATNE